MKEQFGNRSPCHRKWQRLASCLPNYSLSPAPPMHVTRILFQPPLQFSEACDSVTANGMWTEITWEYDTPRPGP